MDPAMNSYGSGRISTSRLSKTQPLGNRQTRYASVKFNMASSTTDEAVENVPQGCEESIRTKLGE
jgi:hypothetical protein